MNNTIEKPTSVLREEFIQHLIGLINNANLPPYVIEPILKDALAEVQNLITIQTEKEKKEYYEALRQQEENQEEKETE